MQTKTIEAKRKERRKQSAEDFTPLSLVNEMLDKLEHYSPDTFTNPTKTYLDPAAGNGNFLIEVLKRKLKHSRCHFIQSLETIFGCDIMKDNISECRLRLLKVVNEHKKLTDKEMIDCIKILRQNIKWCNPKKYPNGSLDYNYAFDDKTTDEQAQEILKKIKEENLLETVNIEK